MPPESRVVPRRAGRGRARGVESMACKAIDCVAFFCRTLFFAALRSSSLSGSAALLCTCLELVTSSTGSNTALQRAQRAPLAVCLLYMYTMVTMCVLAAAPAVVWSFDDVMLYPGTSGRIPSGRLVTARVKAHTAQRKSTTLNYFTRNARRSVCFVYVCIGSVKVASYAQSRPQFRGPWHAVIVHPTLGFQKQTSTQ